MDTVPLWPEGAPHAAGSGEEDCPAITPYLAEGRANPAVVVLPGGGYGMRAAHEGEPIARWLNSIGISAFVLRYRVAPYRYPCALLDAQRAIRTVRAHAERYGVDPGRVGLLGFSAGGHLASTAGTQFDRGDAESLDPIERESCRPDALILCYPVITLKDPYTHAGSRSNLLGGEPDADMVEALSNEARVTPDTPPTFIWHTAEDAAVPVENALQFATALSHHRVPFDLHVYERGGHGLGLADNQPHAHGWSAACASWLALNGFGSGMLQ